jgi:hypothetical protein
MTEQETDNATQAVKQALKEFNIKLDELELIHNVHLSNRQEVWMTYRDEDNYRLTSIIYR